MYVPSVQRSLYRLALAVSAGEPVLLQGPVGCGKTSLVEHLAAVTGRRPYEELLKVQLGDHMDSKVYFLFSVLIEERCLFLCAQWLRKSIIYRFLKI